MITFNILKRSKRSQARLGVISTPHGDIETPSFVPVATRASIRTLDSSEVADAGSQVLICNTYHLHLAPGEKTIKKAGSLHKFMHWDRPIMTDSGGFQVFSLGFGRDHGMGKILKEETARRIELGSEPKAVKIMENGVSFRSPIDGTELFLGPKESIRIQESLGTDIMLAFDECPSPIADENYMRSSLEKTHRWAKMCLDVKKTKQALYGIVQGGAFKHLRIESAKVISALPFDGFAIGGEFGYDKKTFGKVLSTTNKELPENKPRHVLGVGHPEDFPIIAKAGGDTFDCIAPTHYARRGTLFTSQGRLDIARRDMMKDQKPIDPKCKCDVCKNYSRGYVSHLLRAKDQTGMKLATMHNLFFFNKLAADIRKKIGNGEL